MTGYTYKPLPGRVLVRPDQHPTQTVSGLALPESRQPEQTGTIVALGERICDTCDRTLDPIVGLGDRVIFSWTAGQELWLNGGQERYFIMRASDLLAVVECNG